MKTITLLIPVYNEESVLPQLFKRLDEFTKNTPDYQFEFLFINDGSIDKSFSIIAEQSKKDSRIGKMVTMTSMLAATIDKAKPG